MSGVNVSITIHYKQQFIKLIVDNLCGAFLGKLRDGESGVVKRKYRKSDWIEELYPNMQQYITTVITLDTYLMCSVKQGQQQSKQVTAPDLNNVVQSIHDEVNRGFEGQDDIIYHMHQTKDIPSKERARKEARKILHRCVKRVVVGLLPSLEGVPEFFSRAHKRKAASSWSAPTDQLE